VAVAAPVRIPAAPLAGFGLPGTCATLVAALLLLAAPATPAAGTRVIPLQQMIAKYADADSRFIEIDDVRLHYKDQGQGPAVLLIHGSGGDFWDYDDWTRALLAEGWRVVRLDLPGFGLTGQAANGNYSVDRAEALVDGLMDEIGLERFAIVGTSYGGLVAFRHAASMSDTVSRAQTPEGLKKPFTDPTKITDAWVDRKVDFMNIVDRDREGALAIDQYVRGKPERVLTHLRAPVLVFRGGASKALSQHTADRFHAALTRASYREKVVQPGGGHLMHVEMPAPTVATVAAFLERHVRPKAPVMPAAPATVSMSFWRAFLRCAERW